MLSKSLFDLRGAAVAFALVGSVPVASAQTPVPAEAKAARKAARTEIAAASKLARVPRTTAAGARTARLMQAVEAYARVESRFAKFPHIAGEAAFRRGVVLGRLRRVDDAIAAFRIVTTNDAGGFGPRAWLEAGHVLRRAKQFAKALASYREGGKATGRYADQGRLWAAKTLLRLGRVPDARSELERLGTDAKAEPGVRILAFDELAMTWVKEKRPGEVRKVFADAESALAAETAGETKKAQSLRRRIGRMRARKSLERLEKRLLRRESDDR